MLGGKHLGLFQDMYSMDDSKVINQRVLTTKQDNKKFQFVYICSLLNNARFLRQKVVKNCNKIINKDVSYIKQLFMI